jgi:hypothetical protein
MAPRKYESGHQKLKIYIYIYIIEKLIKSQKGALKKFVTSKKQNCYPNINLRGGVI